MEYQYLEWGQIGFPNRYFTMCISILFKKSWYYSREIKISFFSGKDKWVRLSRRTRRIEQKTSEFLGTCKPGSEVWNESKKAGGIALGVGTGGPRAAAAAATPPLMELLCMRARTFRNKYIAIWERINHVRFPPIWIKRNLLQCVWHL